MTTTSPQIEKKIVDNTKILHSTNSKKQNPEIPNTKSDSNEKEIKKKTDTLLFEQLKYLDAFKRSA